MARCQLPRAGKRCRFARGAADIIIRNPSQAQSAAIVANPGAFGFQNLAAPATPDQALAIVDNRARNIGLTRISGLDLRLEYERRFSDIGFRAFVDAAHLFTFENRVTPTAVPEDVLDTIYNPVSRRHRNRRRWFPV
jgi:iron complex outermembrane recepter protein